MDHVAGAGVSRPACRRCASRSEPAIPFPRPALRDCGRYRRRALSAARCTACEGRCCGECCGRSRRAFVSSPVRSIANRSTPPASAESRRASCRRRLVQSAAPIARPVPSPAVPVDARAAPTRAKRTSERKYPAVLRCWQANPSTATQSTARQFRRPQYSRSASAATEHQTHRAAGKSPAPRNRAARPTASARYGGLQHGRSVTAAAKNGNVSRKLVCARSSRPATPDGGGLSSSRGDAVHA